MDRPAPPPVPTKETPNPTGHEDTPGTGELSSETIHPSPATETVPSPDEQQSPQPTVEIPIRGSPIQSPGEASDTMASETVLVSSPEPAQATDVEKMDMCRLQQEQYLALEKLQRLNRLVTETQDYAFSIAKRMRTMRESQGAPAPKPAPKHVGDMEKID